MSRSSLYYSRVLPGKDQALKTKIEEAMENNPGYGYRRIALELGINHKRALRVMNKFGLKPARRAKAPRKRQDVGNEPAKVPDILSKIKPVAPDVIWASDFSHIKYRSKTVYLATVLDSFTGEVLGANVSRRHDATFVRRSIERAIERTGATPQWFHSDQGSEYTSAEIQDYLADHGIDVSMSPKSSPWRNGSQESFFGRFKVEFGDPNRFSTESELIEALYGQIAYFRDRRIKNKLKMAPAKFRIAWFQKQELINLALLDCQKVAA